jgi:hypothetical protein
LGGAPPRGLEHAGETIEIAVHVGRRIFEAVTHSCLRTEVHHVIGLEMLMDAAERRHVSKIGLHKAEALQFLQLCEARALQLAGRVIVQVVHTEHLALV